NLKSGGPLYVYDYFAGLFVSLWFMRNGPFDFRDAVFVPAPPRENGLCDHAFCLAQCFSHWTGARVQPALERARAGQQKFRDKNDRRKIALQVSAPIDGDVPVIFVD